MSLYVGNKKYAVGIYKTEASGTINITANGTHNVAGYASAEVNIPTGTTPTGTLSVTANGTYDVANYASAVVNVIPAAKTGTYTPTSNKATTTINVGFSGCKYFAIFSIAKPETNRSDALMWNGTTGYAVISRYRSTWVDGYGSDIATVSVSGTTITITTTNVNTYFQSGVTYRWIAY